MAPSLASAQRSPNDGLEERAEHVAETIRRDPGAFRDPRSMAKAADCSAEGLAELFRIHYHTTPARFLEDARLRAARKQLGDARATESTIASALGFPSKEALGKAFIRASGITPATYRRLEPRKVFTINLPKGYPLPYLRRALSRDPHTLSERWRDATYEAALSDRFGEAVISLSFGTRAVEVTVSAGGPEALCRRATALLGLGQDTAGFAQTARALGLDRLVLGRESLSIVQTASVFEGLTWSILGQQISFPFACMLKRRLTHLAGTPLAGGLIAPPTARQVAVLDRAALLSLQFSRQKADYLLSLSRAIAADEFPAEGLLEMSATRAERTLLAVRGIGPWSANYVMMRSLGLLDCLPLGDTGVTSALQALFRLKQRPGKEQTLTLMAPFSPYRSLATTHLWAYQSPIP